MLFAAFDRGGTPARPASTVWIASVDVLRRTRRSAYTIRAAAPDVNASDVVPPIARGSCPYQAIWRITFIVECEPGARLPLNH